VTAPGRAQAAARRAVPARALIETFLAFVRPALDEHGEWDEVAALVHRTLAHGTGAHRQLWAFTQAGRFEDVVDLIVEETARGTE